MRVGEGGNGEAETGLERAAEIEPGISPGLCKLVFRIR